MTKLFEADPWDVAWQAFDQTQLKTVQTIFATSNGYLGRQGAFEETGNAGSYVNGLYGQATTANQLTLVNVPDYGAMKIKINGTDLVIKAKEISEFEWTLGLHNGVLRRQFDWTQKETTLRFTFENFISQATVQLVAFSAKIEVLAGDAEIELVPMLNGTVVNRLNADQPLFEITTKGQKANYLYLQGQVPSTNMAFNQWLAVDFTADQSFTETLVTTDDTVGRSYQGQLTAGETLSLTRIASITHGMLSDVQAMAQTGLKVLLQGAKLGYEGLLAQQQKAWQTFWDDSEVTIEGDDTTLQALRYNIAQLWMRRPQDTSRWSSNGLSDEVQGSLNQWYGDYFAATAFAGLTVPKISRYFMAHLYEQLPDARQKASALELAGAYYPLTTVADQELQQDFPIVAESIYTDALVTYEIYTYMNYTNDQDFMLTQGAEILVAIGQFWSSRVDYLASRNLYTFLSVTGPNQYELNVNHNWFVNQMAAWSLNYIITTLQKLNPDVLERLQVTPDNLTRWAEIRDHLYLPAPTKAGIYPQSSSYQDKILPATALRPSSAVVPASYLRLPFIQQPDVLLGLWFLESRFKKETRQTNFDYYAPLTLSEFPVTANIHGLVAATLDPEEMMANFKTSLRGDLDQTFKLTQGLHLDAMSTSWLVLVHGLAGIRVDKGQLSLRPFCPKDWQRYSFHFYFQGRRLQITVTPDVNEVRLLAGDPLTIQLDGRGLIIE
ncbi:glycosyl hydrolase family 65 protein [Agrilactobacillus yilanensis]|uniref:Glycosyl hydrolase family 65 protein n=1 Tax=Agrilactobacillus yilanensis TaxID=2485997 RepID=A0ABW4J7D1_9LACO|nr:glycosyl hydrolase family 65 protein [Agrilactobacillus yilanensis]